MKTTIEIPEDDLIEAAKQIAIGRIADDIMKEYRSGNYCYRHAIKECVREAIKGDIDTLAERAVKAAAVTISNKALKRMIENAENM